MPVKDIGGGNVLVDLTKGPGVIDQASDQLRLLDLVQRTKAAPLQQQKLAIDIENAQLDTRAKQMAADKTRVDLGSAALGAAVTGNVQLANELFRTHVNPNATILQHSDPNKARRGIFIMRNDATGETADLDPFRELGIKKQMEIDAELLKDRRQKELTQQFDSQKWTRDKAMEMWQGGLVGSLQEGLARASAIDRGAKDFSGLSDEQLADRLQSRTEVRAAYNALLSGPATARKPLEKDDEAYFGGLRDSQRSLSIVADQMSRVAPGKLNSTLGQVLKGLEQAGIGSGDPQYAALKSLTNLTLFEKIKQNSGAAFTEAELKAYRELMPNENDTLGGAYAKIAAVQGLVAMKASDRFSVLEASGKRTEALRKLFQGDTPALAVDQASAQAILNILPPSVRDNEQLFGTYLKGAPPFLAKALATERLRAGKASGASIMEVFGNGLGRGR